MAHPRSEAASVRGEPAVEFVAYAEETPAGCSPSAGVDEDVVGRDAGT